MTREEIQAEIIRLLENEFEIKDPGMNDNLRDVYGFDSIDAIDLLGAIEKMLNSELTQAEKKAAMDIKSINQIVDYIETLIKTRS